MKKVLRIVGYILLFVIIAVACLLTYVKTVLPNVDPAPDLKVEATPERIARGEYLANHVTLCIDCHSKRNWNEFTGPPVEGTFGQGGEIFNQAFGFPGSYVSRNITPFNLAKWTDGEIFRTVTTGVNKDGKALFSIMPYLHYGKMDEEDVKCIIAYIRTLKSIESHPEESYSDFPMNFIINTIPQKAELQKMPAKADVVAYGKYVTNAAGCYDCHTQMEKGKYFDELAFSGGFEFKVPWGTVRSANITPDKETGIGNWSKEAFIQRFKMYADSANQHIPVAQGSFNTVMPWVMYAGMDNEDLGAIYEYLRTVKPLSAKVVKFDPKK